MLFLGAPDSLHSCNQLTGICVIWYAYRPWALNWGATRDEIHVPMVGDEIVADASFNETKMRCSTCWTAPSRFMSS